MKEITPLDFRILWIEDQPEEYGPLLEDLQGLVGQGNLVLAYTEEEGRSQLRGHAFDLVLLDLMLPQNDVKHKIGMVLLDAGQRLLGELRQNTDWVTSPDCKVVVCTARRNPDVLAEVEESLFPHGRLIQKPAPMGEIVRVIREMLEEIE